MAPSTQGLVGSHRSPGRRLTTQRDGRPDLQDRPSSHGAVRSSQVSPNCAGMLEHYAANGLCDRGTGRLAFCAAGRAHGPLVIAAGRYFYRETAAEDDPSNRITNCGTVDCRQPRTGISIMTIVANRVIIATWLLAAGGHHK